MGELLIFFIILNLRNHILKLPVYQYQKCGNMVQDLSNLVPFYTGQAKLEDLKVLRRSPDLFNNVKIGQGQMQLILKHILFYHILGLQPFWSSDLNNLMNNLSNSPVISVKKLFR